MTITPEQQFDITPYYTQLDILQSDHGARIVGSLGRMVLCQQILGKPLLEIDDRLLNGITLADRQPDIDVLNASDEVVEAAKSVDDGQVIDTIAFNDTDLAVYRDGYIWLLECTDQHIVESIDNKFMEPNVEKVRGVEIVTLPLVTQYLLHTLRTHSGKKDVIATNVFSLLDIEREVAKLTPTQLAPFNTMRNIIRKNTLGYGYYGRHSETDDDYRHSEEY